MCVQTARQSPPPRPLQPLLQADLYILGKQQFKRSRVHNKAHVIDLRWFAHVSTVALTFQATHILPPSCFMAFHESMLIQLIFRSFTASQLLELFPTHHGKGGAVGSPLLFDGRKSDCRDRPLLSLPLSYLLACVVSRSLTFRLTYSTTAQIEISRNKRT